MTVATRKEAWEAANKIFPTDYEQDTIACILTGYCILFVICRK